MRKGSVKRTTKETDIEVAVDLDGEGRASIATGIGFLDHMLDLLARHSRIDISVQAKGDLHIDHHHTTEDVGIALGQALKQALGDMKGITRYADVHVPMDEALTRVAIDISGRPSPARAHRRARPQTPPLRATAELLNCRATGPPGQGCRPRAAPSYPAIRPAARRCLRPRLRTWPSSGAGEVAPALLAEHRRETRRTAGKPPG